MFLVPAGENAAEARRYAGNLRIIPVTSFQQALSALAKDAGKLATLQDFAVDGQQPLIAGLSGPSPLARPIPVGHNGPCPRGTRSTTGDASHAGQSNMQGLLLPQGGTLRTAGRDALPHLPRRRSRRAAATATPAPTRDPAGRPARRLPLARSNVRACRPSPRSRERSAGVRGRRGGSSSPSSPRTS